MGEKDLTDEGLLPDDPEQSDPGGLAPPWPVFTPAALDVQMISKVALRIVGNADAAHDISRGVYTDVLAMSPTKLESIGCLQAYANRCARNAALNWLRARRGRDVSLESLKESEFPQQDLIVQMSDLRDMKQELNRLPKGQSRVAILLWVHGYTAEEVAKELGITPEAVTKRAARARKRLKRAWEHSCAHKTPKSKEQE